MHQTQIVKGSWWVVEYLNFSRGVVPSKDFKMSSTFQRVVKTIPLHQWERAMGIICHYSAELMTCMYNKILIVIHDRCLIRGKNEIFSIEWAALQDLVTANTKHQWDFLHKKLKLFSIAWISPPVSYSRERRWPEARRQLKFRILLFSRIFFFFVGK